jgi:hypothetical protein
MPEGGSVSGGGVIVTSSFLNHAAFTNDPAATIDRSSVIFALPDGDDRDHDTITSVFIKKQDGTAISGDPNVAPGQHLKDPGTYGPYNLPIQTPVTLGVYKGGFCEVIISPNGHDHWITNFVLLSHFSDGTVVHSESGIVGLDQNNTTLRFGL